METDRTAPPLTYLTSLMNSLFDATFKAEALQTDPVKFLLSRSERTRPPLAKPISEYVSRIRTANLQSTSSTAQSQQVQVAATANSPRSTQSASTQTTPGPNTTSRSTQTPSGAAQSSKRRLDITPPMPPPVIYSSSMTARIDHNSLHGIWYSVSITKHFSYLSLSLFFFQSSLNVLRSGRFLRQTWLAFETADTQVQQRAVSELVAFVRHHRVLEEVLAEAGSTAPTLILATAPFSADAVLDLRTRSLAPSELASELYDDKCSYSYTSNTVRVQYIA